MFQGIRNSTYAALVILAAMAGLMIASIRNESAIVDELAHIPAGYAYVTQLDYRLNPEHPPLLKAISGMFVRAFVHPTFPTNIPSWQTEVNGQWGMGYSFLYGAGNDADAILFWARIPVILLSIFFGWLFYQWIRRRFGAGTAFLALMLYSFSPTILAHSRYVTTDLGASFGFFIGIASFIALLEKPTMRNVICAGVCFGVAQLLKFSLVLLIPMDAIIFLLWAVSAPAYNTQERFGHAFQILGRMITAFAIGLGIIWSVYALFVYHYPPERQLNDATYLLSSYGFRLAANTDLLLIKTPVTRPLGQYILGILMVQQRAAGGNTAYFLGEVTNRGSRFYFPLLYLLKEPLPLHVFSLCALWYMYMQFLAWRRRRAAMRIEGQVKIPGAWQTSIKNHFVQWSCVIVIAVYWIVSIKSPLNIGVRHVMPTFPFIYILVSYAVMRWIHPRIEADPKTWSALFKNIYQMTVKALPKYFFAGIVLLWLIAGTLGVTPFFLSFYNELAGGTAEGWQYAVDSNYDWGQDLKRLADFVKKNNINSIALDYFGGAVPQYYLGSRVESWSSLRGQLKGWFAISSTFRQGSFGTPAPGFTGTTGQDYAWLKQYSPVARAGYSIFIYNLPE